MVAGVKHLRRASERKETATKPSRERLPAFSIIVPAKDEEKVVSRLLESLLKLDYPLERREIIVVEDGSVDRTAKICVQYAEEYPDQIRLVQETALNGKPSALNCALKHVKGEIVGILDADSAVEPDMLLKAASYFEDLSTTAVQGRACSINAYENMLARFISCEEAVRYETYIRGKDVLSLFVPLTGSCYFVRRSILEEVGGWDDQCLSEDMEMAAKLTERNHNIKYASDVRSWQENPTSFTQLLRQRTRWFRGCMEVSLKYGKLLKKVNRCCIDAEITLFAPFLFVPFLLGCMLGIYGFVSSIQLDLLSSLMAQGMVLLTTVTLFLIGTALFYIAKPRKLTSLLWVPFVYLYLSVQNFIALYALFQILLRRPRRWVKTAKTGTVTNCAV
jgi:cellulose synthase/poly-beta-1,6-N-acetylglucosamine synthase-like glycosyltransferase